METCHIVCERGNREILVDEVGRHLEHFLENSKENKETKLQLIKANLHRYNQSY